jgi:REP element-mobilizing transposase RayT
MTPNDPQHHHRRSIRLPGYDYNRPGAYFVTLVTAGRECLLGEVAGGEMRSNRCGEIVCRGWLDLPRHYPHAVLDAFMCMPNHVHGIVILRDDAGRGGSISGKIVTPSEAHSGELCAPDSAQTRPYEATRHGVPEIIRAFKSFSARRINILRNTSGVPVWQRNYYEHIIRGDADLSRIRAYILDNPRRWDLDQENPLKSG